MTSYNILFRIELDGYDPARERDIQHALEIFLERMGLHHEFPVPLRRRRVDGGTMLVGGSRLPHIIVNPGRWEIDDVLLETLEPLVPADATLRFPRQLWGEENDDDERAGVMMHHVRSCNAEQVQRAVGNCPRNRIGEFAREYRSMPAWEQRAQLVHLTERWRLPETEAIHRDFLGVIALDALSDELLSRLAHAVASLLGATNDERIKMASREAALRKAAERLRAGEGVDRARAAFDEG